MPEPATWAMLLVGIGAVGWTLRRRAPGLAHGATVET
ncbi:MAG TPA: PEPxxWA-CTERM sorting domain-containing protein [Novosphingobium sp.]|nr:PEPxxWA-CTERM sorting domain-containing protein [Novosphingobium sp.]